MASARPAGTNLLSDLPSRLAAPLLAGATARSLAADEVLFMAGDPGDGLYRVDDGLLKVSIASASGAERILAILGPGSIVGDLAIIDGVESIAGGEGPWIRGIRSVQPGILIAGTNPVCTDAVGAAVMGYDPQAKRGTPPFQTCENTLLLAEGHGVGTADLKRIDVRGVSITQALYKYDA